MNLKSVFDVVSQALQKILDAHYTRRRCEGTTKRIDKRDGKLKHPKKQVIPTREEADEYANSTDLYRYIAYLDKKEGVETPHYTGCYFCPYCNGWHLTSHGTKKLRENTFDRCKDALYQGIKFDIPEDDRLYELYNMPDYTDEDVARGRKELAEKSSDK